MRARMTARLLALAVALALAFGLWPAGGASAQAGLPEVKEPGSVRYDVVGAMTLSGTSGGTQTTFTFNISGNGAISGDNLQQDVTITLPEEIAPAGTPNSITSRMILVDGKLYMKLEGPGAGEQKWSVTDAGDLVSSDPTGFDPALAEAFQVQQVGKEAVNNAPTTKHQIDVDMAKLADLSGETDPEMAEIIRNGKMVMYMWVGDNDQYLHRFQMTLNLSGEQEGATILIPMDLTMTFRDFNTPVTITAPPASEVVEASGVGSGVSTGPVAGMPMGTFTGIPGAFYTGMPAGMPVGMPTGMPTTGAGDEASPFPWVLAALALLCLALGGVMRRLAVTRS